MNQTSTHRRILIPNELALPARERRDIYRRAGQRLLHDPWRLIAFLLVISVPAIALKGAAHAMPVMIELFPDAAPDALVRAVAGIVAMSYLVTLLTTPLAAWLALRWFYAPHLAGALAEAGLPLCAGCGYPLAGSGKTAERCPECGQAASPVKPAPVGSAGHNDPR